MERVRPRVLICPFCQAENRLDAERCWICREPPVLVIGADQAGPPLPAGPRQSFRLGSLMLLIALVAVCLGVTRGLPALGIVLITISVPALARTLSSVKAREAEGRPMTAFEKLQLFAGSAGAILVIGISALVAFAAACFPFALVAMAVHPPLLVVGVTIGSFAAGYTILFLTRVVWTKRSKI